MTPIEDLRCRRVRATDLSQMLQIMDEALELPTIADEIQERLERWLPKIDPRSQYIFYVAEIGDNNIIGWCRGGPTIECRQEVANQIYQCEIQNIFVRPQYQGRGVGGQLWRILWNDIIQHFHPKNLVVWSVDKEKTQRFYLSRGGTEQEQKAFADGCVLRAFTWDNPQTYQATSLVITQ